MIILSDIHANPYLSEDDQKRRLRFLAHIEILERNHLVVILGDAIDLLENGTSILQDDFCQRVFTWCMARKWVRGNHDPVKELPDHLLIDGWYFCHGHQFERLYGWLPIYRIPVPSFIQKLYITPAQKKQGELLDYHEATAGCEFQATKFGVKHGYKGIVFGHTHSPCSSEREGFTLINDGDAVDSFSYVILDTQTNDYIIERWQE